jgi:hypothetical protein
MRCKPSSHCERVPRLIEGRDIGTTKETKGYYPTGSAIGEEIQVTDYPSSRDTTTTIRLQQVIAIEAFEPTVVVDHMSAID